MEIHATPTWETWKPFPIILDGSKVTTRRLYPELNKLLQEKLLQHDTTKHNSVPNELIEALREHAFNSMPLRLILLPQIKLVGWNEFVDHIVTQMTVVDHDLLSEMKEKIDILGALKVPSYTEDLELEDAREDPWKAICQFLFQKYARYGILSHTWLPIGEIIYQDTLEKDWLTLEGPGIDKLKRFCQVTYRDHGISLAWIDTLCINKDSSAELDEAIQSMYKWYENSFTCITYLRDTTSHLDMESDNWFRRGWTLQELIAPKSMHFYNRFWNRITPSNVDNDKAKPYIQEVIYKVTGIGQSDLVSFDPLASSDVPTRMRWAASRKTTRGEDRAYSLMGIFGVNFSISYGEGAERAFFRLIEAIISSRHTSHVIQVLHWAGKAIFDRIHTSRLIPSGPECYVQKNSDAYAIPNIIPTLSEPMVLSHLGLRVRLLLVCLHIAKIAYSTHGPFYVEVGVVPAALKSRGILDIPLEKRLTRQPTIESLLQFYNRQMPTPHGNTFFLGIYTFKEDDDEDCICLSLSLCAFLLGIPTPKRDFSMSNISSKHFEPTAKIDTAKIVQLSAKWVSESPGPEDTTQEFISIKRELLEEKGMKVVSVFL